MLYATGRAMIWLVGFCGLDALVTVLSSDAKPMPFVTVCLLEVGKYFPLRIGHVLSILMSSKEESPSGRGIFDSRH